MDARRQTIIDIYLFSALCVLLMIAYVLWWGVDKARYDLFEDGPTIWFAAGFVAGAIAHEAIHVLAFFTDRTIRPTDIRFAFDVNLLSPYVSTRVPLAINSLRISALAPLLLLGVMPALAAFYFGMTKLFVLAVFMIHGASTDVTLWRFIRKIPKGYCADFSRPEGIHFLKK